MEVDDESNSSHQNSNKKTSNQKGKDLFEGGKEDKKEVSVEIDPEERMPTH